MWVFIFAPYLTLPLPFFFRFPNGLSSYVRYLAGRQQYYEANIWAGQPRRIVIVTEHAGLFDFLRQTGRPYGVVVLAATGGFGTVSGKHQVSLELQQIVAASDKPVLALYVGDLDESGVVIESEFYDALRRYGMDMSQLQTLRVALTPEQVPTLPEKCRQHLSSTNANYKRFRESYPDLDYGYQAEAVGVLQLRPMVVAAIEAEMDLAALADAQAVSRSVSNWLTNQFRTIILDYEAAHEPLDTTVRRAGQMIDLRTRRPLMQELRDRYLPSDDDDDDDDLE